jgi:hypothetical protein
MSNEKRDPELHLVVSDVILRLILGIAIFTLFGYYTTWQASVVLFFLLWGNNYYQSKRT